MLRKRYPRVELSREALAIHRWYNRTSNSITNYPLLLFVAGCQALTFLISWPVWNVRPSPPLLPLIPLPELSFGLPLMVSLLVIVAWPRIGVASHLVVLLVSIVADQHRLQPQVISLAVLMLGCLQPGMAQLTRWYLIAMWLWAGLHKFLSPEWYGFQSWWFLEACGFDGDSWHLPFAIFVATFETALGVLAIARPKWAAWPAVALHLGLLLLLSPLVRNFNVSVWPWNAATAAAAYWLFATAKTEEQPGRLPVWVEWATIATLLIGPALYYVDLVNPHLAFVLYSGNLPRAIHVRADSYSRVDGWTGLTVPFPDSHWLFRRKFEQTARPGERLHIADPRAGFNDRYFVMQASGTVEELTRDEYWRHDLAEEPAVVPLELEDPHLVWQLKRGGYVLASQGAVGIASAISVPSPARDAFPIDPSLICGLPNLRELRWDDLSLDDNALRALTELHRLEILKINRCQLPPDTFEHLTKIESLRWLRIEGGELPRAGLREFCNSPQLGTLKFPNTDFGDEDCALLEASSQLDWLELNGTRITSQGIGKMPVLQKCTWLTLADTEIDDAGIDNLQDWPQLEVLNLARTNVTERAVDTLSRLPKLQHLDLTGTTITAAGKARLKTALPAIVIVSGEN